MYRLSDKSGQVRLCELERWEMLMHQLPHAVQEEQEHGSLRGDKTRVMAVCRPVRSQWSLVQCSHLDSCLSGHCMLWEAHSGDCHSQLHPIRRDKHA